MTDAGLMGKASIDWDHLDTTDSTGELGSLINLAQPRGFHVSAAADEIFEVEEKLTGPAILEVVRPGGFIRFSGFGAVLGGW